MAAPFAIGCTCAVRRTRGFRGEASCESPAVRCEAGRENRLDESNQFSIRRGVNIQLQLLRLPHGLYFVVRTYSLHPFAPARKL